MPVDHTILIAQSYVLARVAAYELHLQNCVRNFTDIVMLSNVCDACNRQYNLFKQIVRHIMHTIPVLYDSCAIRLVLFSGAQIYFPGVCDVCIAHGSVQSCAIDVSSY